jgi:hypothetical protein
MRLVRKFYLVFAFTEYPAVWICCGYCLLNQSAALIVVIIFNWLLSMGFSVGIYLPPELFIICLCNLGYLFLLTLLFVRTGFDLCPSMKMTLVSTILLLIALFSIWLKIS